MLAIAAPSFNLPSETFIRQHVRTLAPQETILLCQDAQGAERFGRPILSDFASWPPPRSLQARVFNGIRRQWGLWTVLGLGVADRRRVLDFFAAHRAKALLAEYGMIGCVFMRACEEAKVPFYVHFHGFDASILLRDWRWVRHYRALFQKAAGIIAPSRFLAGKLLEIGCPEAKLHVSPCGIDPIGFTPTRRLPQRIVAVGRLVEKKAPHLTIAAFGRIARYYPEAVFDIVGDGRLGSRCRALIQDLGLADRVRMHGVQSSDFVAGLMQEACLFVQHSVTARNGDAEGLPVAILEAMACALPVVSTRHSGIPEAVEDGMTGLLVDEHDVEGMAAAMAELLDNPDRAAAMGAAGRQRVLQHFTLDHTRDRLRAIMGFPSLVGAEARVT